MSVSPSTDHIKNQLDHPIIDADGHSVEFTPVYLDYLKQVAGPDIAQRFEQRQVNWYTMSPQERLDKKQTRPVWWALPSRNTLDRATAILPNLLNKRLDEMGIDFAIIYPTLGLMFPGDPTEDVRRATCRALNAYQADIFRSHHARMTPVAVIPLTTPQEGIEELEHAVRELGFKAIMVPSLIRRPITAAAEISAQAGRYATWLDTLGFESLYDYDPFWAKCVELKVAVTVHSGGTGWGTRQSVNNYMFNHIGNFAAASEGFCRSLVLGGVTRRFPSLKFAFLEGGVAWASSLYAALIAHWEKRNRLALEHYNPAALDHVQLAKLFREFGDEVIGHELTAEDLARDYLTRNQEAPAMLDEFAACGFSRAEDIREQFTPNFYFGCEADDPQTATAFDRRLNPLDAVLKPVLGSDIGHWDVPNMNEALAEAWKLVEDGILSPDEFRDFSFANSVTLHGGMNPGFYQGTAVEAEAKKILEPNPA